MAYRTLDPVIEDLKERGLVERFDVRDSQLRALGRGRTSEAESITREDQRVEGVSDLDETRSRTKGLLADAFGSYANPDVGRLLEKVESYGEAR